MAYRHPMRFSIVVILAACASSSPAPTTPTAPPPAPTTPTTPAPAPGDEKFTGRLTSINFGCAVDASCNLVVDGTKHVHFGHDTRGQPPTAWGTADSLWPLMQSPDHGVGKRVEVFAARIEPNYYTIEGKADYYIKVLDP